MSGRSWQHRIVGFEVQLKLRFEVLSRYVARDRRNPFGTTAVMSLWDLDRRFMWEHSQDRQIKQPCLVLGCDFPNYIRPMVLVSLSRLQYNRTPFVFSRGGSGPKPFSHVMIKFFS
jgi:hypothetical protein